MEGTREPQDSSPLTYENKYTVNIVGFFFEPSQDVYIHEYMQVANSQLILVSQINKNWSLISDIYAGEPRKFLVTFHYTGYWI